MSANVQLIWKKIEHLRRMRNYLDYSLDQTLLLMPISDWHQLKPAHHETLAAFRVRFSEFQEHLGKLMRAIAREEEQSTEPFSFVLLYMEKLGILDTVDHWKIIRELRNAVNHEYEENEQRLSEFFTALTKAAPELYAWFNRIIEFCESSYPAPDSGA
jgi:hypothetical protein